MIFVIYRSRKGYSRPIQECIMTLMSVLAVFTLILVPVVSTNMSCSTSRRSALSSRVLMRLSREFFRYNICRIQRTRILARCSKVPIPLKISPRSHANYSIFGLRPKYTFSNQHHVILQKCYFAQLVGCVFVSHTDNTA